jgi:hypothetical protein
MKLGLIVSSEYWMIEYMLILLNIHLPKAIFIQLLMVKIFFWKKAYLSNKSGVRSCSKIFWQNY